MKRITTSRTKNRHELYPVFLDGVEIGAYRIARDCGEMVCRFFPGGNITEEPWQFSTVWEMRTLLPSRWEEKQRREEERRRLHDMIKHT